MIKMDDTYSNVARIKVIGVGGAGGNAVNRMVRSGFTGVEFITINTDQLALDHSLADLKIPIGGKITKGLGAGARPERGFQAIQEDRQAVADAIDGADMIFITAGMGGGTGTGAAPVVAEIAREKGILSVAVVTRPFVFEGPVREKNSRAGFEALRKNVDTIIVIQNQKILSISSKQTQVSQAFKLADDVLANAVRGICDIILHHGGIQVDFADVKTVMENGGDALMGTGVAEGEGRALAAAERAIHSPLLNDIDITGASGVLVNISHCVDFSIQELSEVMSYIYEAVGEENQPNIIFGHVEDPDAEMEGKVSVTVIAAGFHKDGRAMYETPSVLPVSSLREESMSPFAPQAPQVQQYAQQAPQYAPQPIVQQQFAQQSAPQPAQQYAPQASMMQAQPTAQYQTAPQSMWEESIQIPSFMTAPTMAMPQQAATMVAPAPVMTQVAELPNPFIAPYVPEMIAQQELAPMMDLRRMPQTEEFEMRPVAQAPMAPVAPAPVVRAELQGTESLWETQRPQPIQHHETSHQRKVESRNTGAVSVHEFYNQPMDDDQDRDVPAFLRNSF